MHAAVSAVAGSAIRWGLLAVLVCAPLNGLHAAPESTPPQLYELSAETLMPHLEENLRHARTRQRRCLKPYELVTAFPILSHESLEGCKFQNETHRGHAISYLLVCSPTSGTTGAAQWRLDAAQWQGTLKVKLGGKNMTFYQRVTATPLGACVQ